MLAASISNDGGGYYLFRYSTNEEERGMYSGIENNPSGASAGVYSIFAAVQPDNKLVLGGDLFARALRNGSPDYSVSGAFSGFQNPNKGIRIFAFRSDNRMIVGEDFTNLFGVNRRYFARLNVDLTLDPEFDPGTGPDSPPTDLIST